MVCYVNNDSFVAEKSFDGMRKHLAQDFDLIYVLELGGNVRKNPTLSGTTHNVFGIQVGVSINLFIRLPKRDRGKRRGENPLPRRAGRLAAGAEIRLSRQGRLDRRREMADASARTQKHNWLTNKNDGEFAGFMPIGSKEYKARSNLGLPAIFRDYSLGVSTNRDSVVYDFDAERLAKRVEQFADDYNAELDRWRKKAKPPKDQKQLAQYVDDFVQL